MKRSFLRLSLLLALLSFGLATHAEFRTIVLSSSSTNYPPLTNLVIGPNAVVELLGGTSQLSPIPDAPLRSLVQVRVVFPDVPGTTNFTKVTKDWGTDWAVASFVADPYKAIRPVTIVGPALIEFQLPPTFGGGIVPDTGFYTIKIIGETGPMTPSTAVVIPADAKGPVNIMMESSTNLVDWVGALPGTYGTSSQQRYFRLRSLLQ